MGIKYTQYFFGQTPLEGVVSIPLQATNFINPNVTLSKYDYIIITSKRSIEAMHFFGYNFKQIAIYCIGEKTAHYARSKGLKVVHISKGYAKDLIREIKPMIEGLKGLYIRPKVVANAYITDESKKGKLDQAICYETLCIKPTTMLKRPAVLLFASPSQIECFLKWFNFEKEDVVRVIGTTTAKALPKYVEASICKIPSLENLKEMI